MQFRYDYSLVVVIVFRQNYRVVVNTCHITSIPEELRRACHNVPADFLHFRLYYFQVELLRGLYVADVSPCSTGTITE